MGLNPPAEGNVAGSVEEARQRLQQGFRILAYQGDLWLYQNALREGLSELRS